MSTDPSTVLIVSHEFHPSHEVGGRRVTALAKHLASQGLRVVVVSAFGRAAIEYGSEMWPGVVCIPVAQPRRLVLDRLVALKASFRGSAAAAPAEAAASVQAALNQPRARQSLRSWVRTTFFRLAEVVDIQKKWSWNAMRVAIREGRRRNAAVVISSGPPYSTIIASWWVARRLGVPYVADMRDPWSDTRPPSEAHPNGTRLLLRGICERIVLNSAAAVTCTTEPLARALQGRYWRLRRTLQLIRNGFDGTVQRRSSETGGRLSILFAGELYLNRDPFPFLRALENLLATPGVDPSRVEATFLGRCDSYGGVLLADWMADKRCAAVVKLVGRVPQAAVESYTDRCTVVLNLAQGQPMSTPAKTYEHLASGREPLVLCEHDSDTAAVVSVAGVLRVDARDAPALDAALRDLYDRHVRQGRLAAPSEATIARYSRAVSNEAFVSLIRTLMASNEPGSLRWAAKYHTAR